MILSVFAKKVGVKWLLFISINGVAYSIEVSQFSFISTKYY